jgi:2-oxoglutarate ferredoxin oxidoreductase subunit alpha
MVAMNAETYTKDVREVVSGGYLIYDSTWPRPALLARDDITVLGVPLAKLCNENFDGVRTRILMKNICYAGALAALLDLDIGKIRELLAETYAKKPALVDSNMKAIELGYEYTRQNFMCPLPMRVAPGMLGASKTAGHILIDGNTAAGLGCVFAGATVGAWYPITPSTVSHGCLQGLRRQTTRRSGHWQEKIRVHPGGGRARRHRHGVRAPTGMARVPSRPPPDPACRS